MIDGHVILIRLILPAFLAVSPAQDWTSLFDGKTLANWAITEFSAAGPVDVENGKIIIGNGATLTGITWNGGTLLRTHYEISLEAMRVSGDDFFCGLTFPVGDASCSLIIGGWGGTTVGLSSIDGWDASENDTTTSMVFEDGRWYRIRLRVTPQKIEAWIDDALVVEAGIVGHKISVRSEVLLSRPLGIATYMTEGAFRNIRIRNLQ
jgi:hypothetical protein